MGARAQRSRAAGVLAFEFKEGRVAVESRALAVDRCADLFGREWIIFPNPSYGEWMKVAGRGDKDRELLTGQPRPR